MFCEKVCTFSFCFSFFFFPNSIVATVEVDCPSGVQLVFGDLSSVPFDAHHPGTEEYLTKQQLLTQCVLALSVRMFLKKHRTILTTPTSCYLIL